MLVPPLACVSNIEIGGSADSRPTPISRAVGCSLISRGCDVAAPVAVILAELLPTRIH